MMISSSSAQGNWKLKLALDDKQIDNKEDNNSNVDAIEIADLLGTIETDNEDDNEQNNSNMFIQFYIFSNNLLIIIRDLIIRRDDPEQMTLGSDSQSG